MTKYPFSEAQLRAFQSSAKLIADVAKSFSKAIAPHLPTLLRVVEYGRQAKLLKESGWLPHYSTPRTILANATSADNLRREIEGYYVREWGPVSSELRERLKDYTISEESKSVFLQALEAHEARLYSLVSRGLFPEIERVMRIEFEMDPLAPITSQKDLQKIAGEIGFSETEPGGLLSMHLFETLIDHLYKHVDKNNLAEIIGDPIPNRHAAIHGYVSYNSLQSSLNAIFITDYIFQVIRATKLNIEVDKSPIPMPDR